MTAGIYCYSLHSTTDFLKYAFKFQKKESSESKMKKKELPEFRKKERNTEKRNTRNINVKKGK